MWVLCACVCVCACGVLSGVVVYGVVLLFFLWGWEVVSIDNQVVCTAFNKSASLWRYDPACLLDVL